MRDVKRINDILSIIGTIWARYPDLRLGQLICNAVPKEKDLYQLEEYELVQYLLNHYKDCFKSEEEINTKDTNKLNEKATSTENKSRSATVRIKELDDLINYQSEFNEAVISSLRSLIFSNPFACTPTIMETLECNNRKITELKEGND